MVNRRIEVTGTIGGNVLFFPIEFDSNDMMICDSAIGKIGIPSAEDFPKNNLKRFQSQIEQLVFKLKELGVNDVHGCFNCKYFVRAGMANTASDNGVCLEGKGGRNYL